MVVQWVGMSAWIVDALLGLLDELSERVSSARSQGFRKVPAGRAEHVTLKSDFHHFDYVFFNIRRQRLVQKSANDRVEKSF